MRQTVADPALSTQPLAALKAWLAITGTSDDAALVDCLAAAAVLCEQFTGLVPLVARFREILPNAGGTLRACTRPVRTVLGVSALGTAERTLDPGEYDAAIAADGSLAVRLLGAIEEERVAIDFEAGSAAQWDTLDPGLRHGLLRHAAHLYRERDTGREDAMPAAVAALWRPYRRVSL